MKWIASFLDAIFANLFCENRFFGNIANKIAGSVEEFAYNVEAGDLNVGALSKTMERVLFWLPIVFIVFLLLDMFIRSRYVRYSYQDEQQAKKSVWWRWQSDADAALALEAGNDDSLQMLSDGQAEEEAPVEETAEEAPAQDIEAAQEAADEQEAADDDVDRSMVTSARQNQMRNVAPAAERTHNAMADMRDQLTVLRGALAFAPRAIKRNARLRKQTMQEEMRHSKERWNDRIHHVRTANQREEAAEAEAMFDVQAPESYVDADFEANEAVNTGGIEGVNFAHAAKVMQAAVQQQAEEAGPAEEPAEEKTEE